LKNILTMLKRIMVVIFSCMLFLSACSFNEPSVSEPPSSAVSSENEEIKPSDLPENNEAEEIIPPEKEIVTEQPPVEEEPKVPDEPVKEPAAEIVPPEVVPPVSKPVKDPLHALYTDTALTEQWKTIDDIAEAAQKYYTENFNLTRIVTKDGYLYNYAAKEDINVNYLIAEGFLSSKYLNKDCDILLLDAEQMKKYSTLKINDSETGLTVFAALRNPKDSSYLMATSKSAGGYLTATQYASLLNGYYQNHGSYGTLFYGSNDYNRIISFINMYESKYEEYCVRSVTKDNKYAIVTLSSKNNTANVKQYILRRNGSLWEVVMEGLENETRAAIAVNMKIPDFNLEMLPDYVIKDYKNSINEANDQITRYLKLYRYISDTAEIKYISSARGFGYVHLKNEMKYLCIDTLNDWKFVRCDTPYEAIQQMEEIKSNAPTFIVLDS